MQNEIWKEINGYNNYYISNKGNVLNIYKKAIKRNSKEKGIAFRFMKPIQDANGYYIITLYKNNKPKNFKIHRLVAETFLSNKNNYPVVNHKNENKLDNRVENLEWCTISYNNKYGTRLKKTAKKLAVPIICYDKNGNIIKKYKSIQSVKKDGFNPSKVCSVCKNKYGRKTHKGYIWKYEIIDLLDNL